MKQTDTIALQGSIADMRQHIAKEQAATHRVKLGVARWRNNPELPDADTPPSPVRQTQWHAEAQSHFICWLELGGFAHADTDAATDSVSTPTITQAPPDTCTSTATDAAWPAATLPVHCNNCAA